MNPDRVSTERQEFHRLNVIMVGGLKSHNVEIALRRIYPDKPGVMSLWHEYTQERCILGYMPNHDVLIYCIKPEHDGDEWLAAFLLAAANGDVDTAVKLVTSKWPVGGRA